MDNVFTDINNLNINYLDIDYEEFEGEIPIDISLNGVKILNMNDSEWDFHYDISMEIMDNFINVNWNIFQIL